MAILEEYEKLGVKCKCGCGRYWENCRAGVTGDTIAESLYCTYNEGFDKCCSCNLVNYGLDCKNNPIN